MAINSIINSRVIQYSDIDSKFRITPSSSDMVLKKDVQAVKQSVLNILLTNKGEKVFHEDFGGNLRSYLFENYDSITSMAIQSRVKRTLLNYEPRISVTSVDVDDTRIDYNALTITVEFIIKSIEELATIEFTVERLR